MKIAVLGNGYLGSTIAKTLPDITLIDTRIKTYDDAFPAIQGFDVVINCIGKTGTPNVDQCELPEQRPGTFHANVVVPTLLAAACQKAGVKLVHISSGCIYDGNSYGAPFTEKDTPNFEKSFYSFTKKTAERAIEHYPNILTLRIRMPLSDDHSPRNLITKLLAYDDVILTLNSITVISEFLVALHMLIEEGKTGIWNIVSPEPISHGQILEIYDEVMGTNVLATKNFIDPKDLKTATPRTNTFLSSAKLGAFIKQRPTNEAVRDELLSYKAYVD